MISVTLVLVVDDSEELRRLLKLIMEREGHHVVLAEDGEDALRAVQAHRPGVILCDFAMPKLDGPGFVRRLRALPDEVLAQTPVIGFSASDDVEEEFLAAGANEVIGKPSHLSEIVRAVRHYAGPASG
jgi:CheY-like chemotaxis protein